jgi:hypothetical protein
LHIIFYHSHFIITAVRDKELQLIQRLVYNSVYEVVYHILNVCERLAMPINETYIVISGLIDLKSALYAELYKYVYHLHIDEAGETAFDKAILSDYPAHYFIPFINPVA